MLMSYRALYGMALDRGGPAYRGPINTLFSDARTLTPDDRSVVTPSADTPFSGFAADLRAGPLRLCLPAVMDRYFSFQFADLYGHNFAYVGTRSTGGKAGRWLLAGPGWSSDPPPDIDAVLRCETHLAFAIGRTQLLGPEDRPNVAALQAVFRLDALPPRDEVAQATWPAWCPGYADSPDFVELFNFLLGLAGPAHPADTAQLDRFEAIGIRPRASASWDRPGAAVVDAVARGVKQAGLRISARAESAGRHVNGWTLLDAFGSRAFFGGDNELRAAGAASGLWGNDSAEALYAIARVDRDARPLDGARADHELRFAPGALPPVHDFWSVTAYDTGFDGNSGYLAANAIDRYKIDSAMTGLQYDRDGGLTLHVQHRAPPPGRQSNWLPVPDAPFYLVLRLYGPSDAARSGRWEPPAVIVHA